VLYFGTVLTVLYFGTVLTVLYFGTVLTVFYFGTVLTVFYFGTVLTVLYFGTVLTVLYFENCSDSVVFWNCSDSVVFFVFHLIYNISYEINTKRRNLFKTIFNIYNYLLTLFIYFYSLSVVWIRWWSVWSDVYHYTSSHFGRPIL
jgi:hypothetical protein